MFTARNNERKSLIFEIFRFVDLLYHTTVRNIRKDSINPIISVLNQIVMAIILVFVFLFFIRILGMRSVAIRGNEVQFIMSGIFLYLVHVGALGAAQSVGSQRSAINLHTHITHLMSVLAAGLAQLYIMILATTILLSVTHILVDPVEFDSLSGFAFAFFMSWVCGMAIGYLINALSPFAPRIMTILAALYTRGNMIFSGKMLVANTLPAAMLPFFLWNPLFHIIDYSRGESFINYTPRVSNIYYPIWVTIVLFVLALMLQKMADKKVSASWGKRR